MRWFQWFNLERPRVAGGGGVCGTKKIDTRNDVEKHSLLTGCGTDTVLPLDKTHCTRCREPPPI